MNKKILMVILSTTGCMLAKPYVGLKLGVSKTQLNSKFYGTDYVDEDDNTGPFSFNHKMSRNSMVFGLLAGANFKMNDKMSTFVEGDYEYLGVKSRKTNIDVLPTPGTDNALNRESIVVSANSSFGVMPGAYYHVNEKMSGLFGIRLNMTQFHVRVFHTSQGHVNNTANEKAKSKFLFGIEPTLGAAYKINEKVGARFTVGYNIIQGKKIVTDYMQQDNDAARAIEPNVTLKPRGLNVRLAMTYSF